MITVNIEKAKTIAHAKRRESRAAEFKPYDEIIMKQIPGQNLDQAESARQSIRDKYAIMQEQMDAAKTVEELKSLLP